MSNSTTAPEALSGPLVIPLIQPREPGSAIERWLWDMFSRGLIDVPTSEQVSQGGATASASRKTPTGGDVSASDSGETTAYSTDIALSEDTTYSSDSESVREVTGKLGGVAIAAGVNEGPSWYTKGKRVRVDILPNAVFTNQRYLVHMAILDQPVANIENFKELYGDVLCEAPCVLELDDGSNTTWFLGSKCREFRIKSSTTAAGGYAYCACAWTPGTSNERSQPLGEREVIFNHACIRCEGTSPVPDGVITGIMRYADDSGAAVLLHDRMLKLSIKCYNWAEKSWKGNLLVHYKPAVAYAVTKTFNDRPQMSGILAIGPMHRQSAFSSAVSRLQAPAFLETLQNYLPPIDEGGIVVYLALRPTALYQNTTTGYQLLDRNAEHWMSFNEWPCKLQPEWSRSIRLIPGAQHWKVRLLSMTFQRYNRAEDRYEYLEDADAGTITFGANGLLVHIDCGSSVTLVPPSLVRHIRTKLWPTAENLKLDAKYKDAPCSLLDPEVPFYAPRHDIITITYKFADGRGSTIEVVGPGKDFLCQPNPYNHSHTKDKEGLIFIGSPDVIGGEAIFGMNFLQTMFVALHTPGDGDQYVRLAPQWEAQRVQFSPRFETDSSSV